MDNDNASATQTKEEVEKERGGDVVSDDGGGGRAPDGEGPRAHRSSQ